MNRHSPPTVLGVDPGGRWTGLVVRRGEQLLGSRLLRRSDSDSRRQWASSVSAACFDLTIASPGGIDLVAVEDLNDPTPHMGVTSVTGLIWTATVLGAVLEWGSSDGGPVVVVPPGGHGNADDGLGRRVLLACYPDELVGDREDKGTGELVHCRAAWDIAAAGARQIRQEAA